MEKNERGTTVIFNIFCLWTFVLLGRPQDLFPFMAPFRPAMITTVLALVTFLVFHKKMAGPALLESRQIKYYLSLYLVMGLSIPFSLYARLSFEIVVKKYIVTILFICIFFKIINSIERLSKVVLIGCLGSGLYFFYALRGFSAGTGSGRLAFGTMFDPNDLAFFGLSFLSFNLLFLSRDNPVWVRLACLGSLFSSLLLVLKTASRGGFIGLCVSVIVLLVFTKKSLSRTFKLFFIGVCVCVFVFSSSTINTERYLSIFSVGQDYNMQEETGRLAIWKIGVRAFIANPLTGVGVGCFGNAVGLDRQQRRLDMVRWQTAHNSVIQVATETGLVGLILYLMLSLNVIIIFNKALKKSRCDKMIKLAEVGMAGFSGMFVSSMFVSQAYSIQWPFYIGLAAVVSRLIARSDTLN